MVIRWTRLTRPLGQRSRGTAVSLYDNLVIDAEYIKAEAQEGRMHQVLYAVAIRTASGERTFRAPTKADLDALEAANQQFAAVKGAWFAKGVLPTEEFPTATIFDRSTTA